MSMEHTTKAPLVAMCGQTCSGVMQNLIPIYVAIAAVNEQAYATYCHEAPPKAAHRLFIYRHLADRVLLSLLGRSMQATLARTLTWLSPKTG